MSRFTVVVDPEASSAPPPGRQRGAELPGCASPEHCSVRRDRCVIKLDRPADPCPGIDPESYGKRPFFVSGRPIFALSVEAEPTRHPFGLTGKERVFPDISH